MSKKGKPMHSATRQIVFNVLRFCEREQEAKHTILPVQKATERVAALTGLSRDTISKIKKEGATNNGLWSTPATKRKGRPKKIILNDSYKSAIRNKIRDYYTDHKEMPSLRKLHQLLIDELDFCGGLTSLRNVLKELGYKYKKSESNKKVLIEQHVDNITKVEVPVIPVSKLEVTVIKVEDPLIEDTI